MKPNKNKINQIANYLEELSWLLESNKNLSLKDISKTLKELNANSNNNLIEFNNLETAEGKYYLVGILPKLLQDIDLFGNNNEMLDFAEQVLGLTPSRAAKRSRIEYIGWIVCEVSNSNNSELNTLVEYLRNIIYDESKIKKIKEAKKMSNFSWNEIIRNMSY